MGEADRDALRLDFDRRLMLQFRGTAITSDGGLIAYWELDDALSLTDTGADALADARTGKNGRHLLVGLLRQSVFGRLAGYEDVNDADRLCPLPRRPKDGQNRATTSGIWGMSNQTLLRREGPMRISAVAVLGTLVILAATSAQGGPIASRPALVALLGGPGTLENFEAFNVALGSAVGIDCAVLSSTAICNGQGPGLVVPGVSFTFGSGGGQWDGAGYFGSPSKEILSGVPAGQPLVIDFASSVGAFGVDLRAFSGFGATANAQIFGPDDTTLIGTLAGITLSSSGVPVFAGWSDAAGIGRVSLTQTGLAWSPIIDNLEFGNIGSVAVPEPGSFLLLLIGLAGLTAARRRRKAMS